MNKITACILVIVAMASCGNHKEKALALEDKKMDSTQANPDSLSNHIMSKPEVFECMMNAIYYKLKAESKDIDTIKTHYFHSIVDYEDISVRAMHERLMRIREILKDSVDFKFFKAKRYEKEMDSLVQEVNRYSKTVVGFILVHSFYQKSASDTTTMIFVLDKNCGYKDAIKIKSIKNLHPEDYINSFRKF